MKLRDIKIQDTKMQDQLCIHVNTGLAATQLSAHL